MPGPEQVQRQRPEDPNNDASKPGTPQTNVDNLQTREEGTVASYLDKGADLLGIGKWTGDKNSTGIQLRSFSHNIVQVLKSRIGYDGPGAA